MIYCPLYFIQSQLPEENYYNYLIETYAKKNKKTDKILIEELDNYFKIYHLSENCDEILYILGKIYLSNFCQQKLCR